MDKNTPKQGARSAKSNDEVPSPPPAIQVRLVPEVGCAACKNLLQVWITHDSTRCNLEANLHLAWIFTRRRVSTSSRQ
jgi:hypothetical protein